MKKLVFTIEDDVCLKNGKSPEMQEELIKKLREYGSVEEYAKVVSSIETAYQTKLDTMTSAYNALAERSAENDYELAVLKAHRASVAYSVQEIEVENDALKESLKKAEEKTIALATSMKATLDAYAKE